MPRLIAIEGPESGLALPVQGAETVLAVGPDKRVKLTRAPEARPPAGAVLRRDVKRDARGVTASESYAIERFVAEGAEQGPPLFVNGEAIDATALQHGDLISYAGITLIFDCDDVGRADTSIAPYEESPPPAPPPPPPPPTPPPASHTTRRTRNPASPAPEGRASPSPEGAAPPPPSRRSGQMPAVPAADPHRQAPPLPPPPARRPTGAFPVGGPIAPPLTPRRAAPPPASGAGDSLADGDDRGALSGDSILYRRKAYQDAEALLRALEEQERALAAGRPPPSRGSEHVPGESTERHPPGAPVPGAETTRRRRRSTGLSGGLVAPSSGAHAAVGAAGAGAPHARHEGRLAFLLKVATAVGSTLDLPSLLERLLDLVFEQVPADRGTILLVDRAAKKLRSMAGKRRGALPGEPANVRVSRTIIKEALSSQESILSVDAMTDERFKLGESVAAAGIRSAMCVPILREGRPLGVIHLDTGESLQPGGVRGGGFLLPGQESPGAGAFTREHLDLLSAIASVVSVSIDNARLYAEQAERERLRAEVTLATAIQQRLLPKAAPASRALDVHGRTIPAKELGGDIFDFVEDHARGTLHVLVGDVSGKGVGAAMIMAMARSYIRPLAAAYVSPREVLVRANALLYDDTARDMFMSAVLLLWEERERRLTYCGAGQENILIVRAGSPRCEAFPAGGIALMMVDDAATYLADQELRVGRGDLVVLYSDGVIDSKSETGEFYGLERLTAALPVIARLPSTREVVERICAEVVAYAGTAEQHDDITVVALRMR